MIPNDIFIDALDRALKNQGLFAAERKIMIKDALKQPAENRDDILDRAEALGRDKLARNSKNKRIKTEFEEQCDFVEWFRAEHPGVVIMAIRNGGTRTPRERVDQIREGLHPGAADLFIPAWRLWIEFKRVKGGVLSEEQAIFRDYVRGEGYLWELAEGCDAGKKIVSAIKK